ncbi:hypothetical protein LguiB_018073 [Lonicera macranthoides]
MARIKVRGNHNGFIPASMMIHTVSDSEYFAFSLVSTSKLICEKRNISRNFSSGGTKPMDFPPLSEGEEKVVLEHSTHVVEVMAQDKITTVTPTKLICDGKTQEKAEDKLDADDLEYESSSFADDVLSTGTVVEDSQEELSRDLLHGHLKPEEQFEKAIMDVIQGHAKDDDLEYDEECTLYNESSDGEKLEDHASFEHFEENGESLMSLFNVCNTCNSISNYIARRDEQLSSWWSQVSYYRVRGYIFKLGNVFLVLTGDIKVNRRLSKLPMIMFYNSEMVIKTGISLTSMVENNDVWVAKSKSRDVTLKSTAIQRILPVISYDFFEADYGGSGACLSTVCKVSAINNELTEADKGVAKQ